MNGNHIEDWLRNVSNSCMTYKHHMATSTEWKIDAKELYTLINAFLHLYNEHYNPDLKKKGDRYIP